MPFWIRARERADRWGAPITRRRGAHATERAMCMHHAGQDLQQAKPVRPLLKAHHNIAHVGGDQPKFLRLQAIEVKGSLQRIEVCGWMEKAARHLTLACV